MGRHGRGPHAQSARTPPAYAFDGTGSGSGTIDPAGLTVTPDDQAITAGSAVPDAGFYTFELSGFVNDETAADAAGYLAPTCTSAYTTTTPASPPTLPITCSGGSAANYTFDTSATAPLTVAAYDDAVAPVLTTCPPAGPLEATSASGAVVTLTDRPRPTTSTAARRGLRPGLRLDLPARRHDRHLLGDRQRRAHHQSTPSRSPSSTRRRPRSAACPMT